MELQDPLADFQNPPTKRRVRNTSTKHEGPPLPDGAEFLVDVNEFAGNHQGYDLLPRREKKLIVGDYSVRTPEGLDLDDLVAVERKSLQNLVGDCAGDCRDRFERCLARLAKVRYSALVIEANWHDIRAGRFSFSRMNPTSVLGSVITWSVRYGVHVWFAGDRASGQSITSWLLVKFLQEATHGTEQDQG